MKVSFLYDLRATSMVAHPQRAGKMIYAMLLCSFAACSFACAVLFQIQSKSVLNTMWLTQSVLAHLQDIATRDPRLSMLSNT